MSESRSSGRRKTRCGTTTCTIGRTATQACGRTKAGRIESFSESSLSSVRGRPSSTGIRTSGRSKSSAGTTLGLPHTSQIATVPTCTLRIRSYTQTSLGLHFKVPRVNPKWRKINQCRNERRKRTRLLQSKSSQRRRQLSEGEAKPMKAKTSRILSYYREPMMYSCAYRQRLVSSA